MNEKRYSTASGDIHHDLNMDKRFEFVSMNGRMAYVIMCVEAYLVSKYSDRDWKFISELMWEATSNNWGEWPEKYSSIIPDVLLQYENYDKEDLGDAVSENEFEILKDLYNGITKGIEGDTSDEVNYMLNKPYEMAMIYEGSVIGDGLKSIRIIEESENVLKKNGIPLPDYSKILFSSSNELNGWGNDFDGRYLSSILND